MGECCPGASQKNRVVYQRKQDRTQRAGSLGDPRDTGISPSPIIIFLPDELFQKVAEDYVSVAAFQVMTGVCFPGLYGDFL